MQNFANFDIVRGANQPTKQRRSRCLSARCLDYFLSILKSFTICKQIVKELKRMITKKEVEKLDNMTIVGRIKRLCQERGISMTKFYKDSGVSSGAMSQWATGKTNPRPTTLAMIADYFGVSPEYLTGEEKEKTAQTDGLTLSQKELIFLFANLSPEQQEKVLAEVKSLLFG